MRKALVVVAVVLAVVCGGLGLIVYRAVDLGRELVNAGVTKAEFDAQKVGASEAAVRAALPEPLTDLKDEELYPGDPGRGGLPADASCIYHTVKPFAEDGAELWRFCFAGGKLIKKSPFTIPE